MKVLIIGGTKFIGKAVASQLSGRGHEVVLFNRGKTPTDLQYRTIVGDVDQIQEHRSKLLEIRPDVIIHAIAYTAKHARDAVEVFSGMNARAVVLSSQDCYEAFYQLNQGCDKADLPLSEDAELCQQQFYWRSRPGTKTYEDYDKNQVTSEFLSAHAQGKLSSSMLRLPMVFGPEDFQFRHRHGKIIRRLYDRHPVLLLGAVEQSSLFTYGFIDNVAAAIVRAAEVSLVDGKVFNIGEAKSRSFRRWAELYATAAGIELKFKILPDAILEQDVSALNLSPRLLQFDTKAFSAITGFSEPVVLSEQIRRTLNWGLERPDALGAKPNYEMERRMIDSYDQFIRETLKT